MPIPLTSFLKLKISFPRQDKERLYDKNELCHAPDVEVPARRIC